MTTATRSTAPESTLSSADQAAHAAASHLSPKGRAALARATRTAGRWRAEDIDAAYAERDEQHAERVAHEIEISGGAA